MKFFAFAVLFSVSFSQAASLNGVTLSNVPTASKSYSKEVISGADVSTSIANLKAECSSDMMSTLADLKKKGARVIKSSGCDVLLEELNGCDQGGCSLGTFVHTNFEILFL